MSFGFKVALIALFGALGSLARFFLGLWVTKLTGGHAFPWGTLACNALGSFAFGVVFGIADSRWQQVANLDPEVKRVLLVGFMGAFTTFSTFAFETHRLWDEGSPELALANVAVEVVLGVLLVVAGLWLGRQI